ncbi:MAG: PAS domain S-box-containing protein [Crocinitomix sp.]|jgi:PAS domain S-box-containing protein
MSENRKEDISQALIEIQENLARISVENEKSVKLRQGMDQLNNILQGDKEVGSLAKEVLKYVSEFVGATVGTLYVTEEDGTLSITAGYAFNIAKAKNKKIVPGEGLLGQVAQDRTIIQFKNIPNNYLKTTSSTGESSPSFILGVPMLYNNNLVGVLELGTFQEPDELKVKYLNDFADKIAITINTSMNRTKMSEVLEALQSQQLEMKSLANELNQQVEALNQSAIVSITDDKGDIIYVNDYFCQISKYSRKFLMGKNHRLLKSGLQPDGVFIGMWKAISLGKTWNGEIVNKAKDGSFYWVDTTVMPFKDTNGKIEKYVAIRFDISAQKKAQTDLKQRERELRSQFDAIDKSNAIIEFDLKGNILKANKNFLNLVGYQEKEIKNKHHSMFLDADYSKSDKYKKFWESLRAGEFIAGEFSRLDKNGKLLWINGSYNPIYDGDGELIKVMKIAIDITDRKNSLLQIDQQVVSLNEAAIVSETDAEGNITFINEMFCKISKFSEKELLGNNHRMLKSGQQPDGLFIGMWKAISIGKIWHGEVCNKAKDGSFYWVDTTITPFKNLKGEIYKYVGVRFDITKQKLQHEELKAQAEELRVQQEELEEFNSELEVQTQRLSANEEELRVQQEELIQSNQELQEKGQLLEEKNQAVNEKNEALERAREELIRQAEELELTSRYKSEFLANMSHELRTPLNSILLLSNLMSQNKEENLTDDQVEFASVIHNSGNGLLELINEILDLSKIESGKMDISIEDLDLNQTCRSLNGIFNPLANEKKIEYISVIEKGTNGKVKTDRLRLEQVLKNLLSNAMKFTEKGKVKMRIYKPTKNTKFTNAYLSDMDVIGFAISDTGIGIPEDKHGLVFEAFQQADGSTKRKYGGTGLGLSISREIAGLLGGELQLESEVGKGSIFTLFVPVDYSEVETTTNHILNDLKDQAKLSKELQVQNGIDLNVVLTTPNEIADDRKKINKGDAVILIVEDDTNFAKILIKYAHDRGYKAVVSVSGGTALAFAKSFNPKGILLDIQLPAKSGWTVMHELKADKATRHIPVHMMSSIDVSTKESVDAGAIDFINKPMAEQQLDEVFTRLNNSASGHPKNILIIEDNETHQMALKTYIEDGSKICFLASTAKEGIAILNKERIDCLILDMGLPDETGYSLLEKIRKQKKFETLPVIVYTGKNLSLKEEQKIKKFASVIVIKTVDSYKRLMDEIGLFLHTVENKEEKKSLKMRKPYITEKALLKKKVIVVDDDPRNILALSKTLENQAMEVLTADNGKSAIEILKNNPDTEMVLMDMMMPEMDGYETMESIRAHKKWKEMPIIAVTAKTMMGDRKKCLDAGASDYISKPVDTDQLLSLMRVWLHKK